MEWTPGSKNVKGECKLQSGFDSDCLLTVMTGVTLSSPSSTGLSYTRHVLRHHIDSLTPGKILFKSVTNINALNCILKYFKPPEPSMICYKYTKPARGILFSYSKMCLT